MDHKIRLGPIAVFLAVIAAVVATLAILTFATSRADVALAERFAAVTAIRYELDKEGGRFLQEVEEAGTQDAESLEEGETTVQVQEGQALPTGSALTGDVSPLDGGGWKYYTEKDGYALTVEVVPAEKDMAADADTDTGNEEKAAEVDTDTENEVTAGDTGTDTGNEAAVAEADTDTENEVSDSGKTGSWQIRKWKINKLWEGDDPFEDLWLG